MKKAFLQSLQSLNNALHKNIMLYNYKTSCEICKWIIKVTEKPLNVSEGLEQMPNIYNATIPLVNSIRIEARITLFLILLLTV